MNIRAIAGFGILGVCVAGLALAPHGAIGQGTASSGNCDTPTTPFCNSSVPFPSGWTGRRFVLAQDYPQGGAPDTMPWLTIDPFKNPGGYTNSVVQYFFEGNVRASVADSFDPRLNTVRGWYNAPWQNVGPNGREPIHGLTRERASMPGELGPNQKQVWNNYAIGFYNPAGGAMIGNVWRDHGKPDPSKSITAEGTVAAKLLFTTASDAEVPWLKGSPGWDAYIFADLHNPGSYDPNAPRKVTKVRLLQLDIAVKDKRSPVGWFFGTFVYGGGPTGRSGQGWSNIAPVGLMWGNDPGYSGRGPLRETWINPAVKMPHLGYQGRLNGPVDNPKSSCLSCHMTAESPASLDDLIANLLPPKGANPARWFQNIPSGKPFTPGKQSNDYSMNMAFGFAGFAAANAVKAAATPALRLRAQQNLHRAAAKPSRGPQ